MDDEQTAVPVKQCRSCGRTLPALEWFRARSGVCSECESTSRRERKIMKSVALHQELEQGHKPQRQLDEMRQVARILARGCLATIKASQTGEIDLDEAARICIVALDRAMPLIEKRD